MSRSPVPLVAFVLPLLLMAVTVSHAPSRAEPPPVSGYRIVQEYPHDPQAFTQGLVYADDGFYEGTGLNGRSTLRRVDLATGRVERSVALDLVHFGEGIALFDDRIYQITWQTQTAFVYDRATFDLLETFTYPTEGWGLTTDGKQLVMSDGTATLRFRDPATFAETGSVTVRAGGEPVLNLNELEYIDGEIWANVWKTDRIARIDATTGDVIGWIDLAGLLSPADRQGSPVDVLNGIAHDPATGRIFVTGKFWPKLFEIALEPPWERPLAATRTV